MAEKSNENDTCLLWLQALSTSRIFVGLEPIGGNCNKRACRNAVLAEPWLCRGAVAVVPVALYLTQLSDKTDDVAGGEKDDNWRTPSYCPTGLRRTP